MRKKLIICPNCEQSGTINILGEIKENGDLAILRFHNGETIIKGGAFTIICGVCGSPIYFRKEKDKRIVWNFRQLEYQQKIVKEESC